MIAKAQNVLCRYHYDPLDRFIGTTSESDAGLQLFYCKSRLATGIQGTIRRWIFQQGKQLLAQQNGQGDFVEISLLAVDQMRSVLQVVTANRPISFAYSPYGHRPTGSSALSLLGFNGEQTDSTTGRYLLGNGYRVFNPVFMRLHSPDNLSPFGRGGLNPYVYCLNDPVNRYDESGRASKFLQSVLNVFSTKAKASVSAVSPDNGSFKLFDNLNAVKDSYADKQRVFENYRRNPDFTNKRYKVPPTKIESARDLDSVPYQSELRAHANRSEGTYEVNYILTKRNELVVGSLKHEMLSTVTNSSDVITAGVISRTGNNSYEISNSSGHFLPTYHSIFQVKQRLESLGASVTTIRNGGKTRLQRRVN